MSTFVMLEWAFSLRGLSPLEKLVAIRFAGSAGTAEDGLTAVGTYEVSAHDLADWCNCNKEDAVVSLHALRGHGLLVDEIDVWRYRITLPLPARVRSAPRDVAPNMAVEVARAVLEEGGLTLK